MCEDLLLLTNYAKAGLDTRIEILLVELLDHLNSIEANTVQAVGIAHRMSVTKALVDNAVYRRGDLLCHEQSVIDS